MRKNIFLKINCMHTFIVKYYVVVVVLLFFQFFFFAFIFVCLQVSELCNIFRIISLFVVGVPQKKKSM